MIKRLESGRAGVPPRIAVVQPSIDETDPAAGDARRAEAVKRAQAVGCSFAAVGGEDGLYEDDAATIVSDASVFTGADGEWLAKYSRRAVETGRPVVVAGTSGVRDGGKAIRVFNGLSGVFTPDGGFSRLLPRFEEGFAVADLADVKASPLPARPDEDFGDKARAVRFGVKTFMGRLGIGRVVVGISGGIDSAVAAALYSSLVTPENLLLVAMPGPFTSQTTRRLARELAANLGARFAEIPIGEAVDLTCRQFSELRSEGPGGGIAGAWELSQFAVENVQARDRGSRVLAAAASAFGGVVSCNANKAEATVGYGTLHGDIFGWLSAIGDLWKGEVYALGRFLNDEVFRRQAIPEGIFTIRPSAELSEAQAIEHGLGDPLDYPYHDKLFRFWVEDDAVPEDCVRFYRDGSLGERIGYDGDLKGLFESEQAFTDDLFRWWGMYRGLAVAKRIQAPPALAVSRKAFGEFRELQRRP